MKKLLTIILSVIMAFSVIVVTSKPVKAATHIDAIYIHVTEPVVGEKPNYDNSIDSEPYHESIRDATLISWYESDDDQFRHATEMESTDTFKENKYYQIRYGSVKLQDPDVVIDSNTKFYINYEPADPTTMRFYTGKKLVRIFGGNRYSTSFAIADITETDFTYNSEGLVDLILTSADNFADALAVSYAAPHLGAAIVVVNEANQDKVEKYIREAFPFPKSTWVYIIGGKNAVPEKIEKSLARDFAKVERIKGANRYETNLAILNEFGLYGAETILIATGTNFADSLSASATKLPILLVGSSLTAKQKEFLNNNKGKTLCILGGINAVSTAVAEELQKYGTVTRISGSNRYETSKFIADQFFPDCKVVSLAYGGNFPDGLCGGPLAAREGGPLLLVNEDNYSYARSFVKAHTNIICGIAFGGQGVLSDSLFRKVMRERSHALIRQVNYEVYSNDKTYRLGKIKYMGFKDE